MKQEIDACLRVLKEGGVILYPTDTIWGLGCDATNEEAVKKIYAIKKRSDSKALIVLVSDDRMLNKYVPDAPLVSWEIIEQSETPVTIVYEGVRGLAKNVGAEDGSCGIRLTKDEFCHRLIYTFNKPIVSSSANVSGEDAPRNFSEISESILQQVDHVVGLRQEETRMVSPSSIIAIKNNGEVRIIRK